MSKKRRRLGVGLIVLVFFVATAGVAQFTPMRWLVPVSLIEMSLEYQLPEGSSLEEVQAYCQRKGYRFTNYWDDPDRALVGHGYFHGKVGFVFFSTSVYSTFYMSDSNRLVEIQVERVWDSL